MIGNLDASVPNQPAYLACRHRAGFGGCRPAAARAHNQERLLRTRAFNLLVPEIRAQAFIGGSRQLTVGDHYLAEMPAALEVTIGFLCLGEREDAVDHRLQPVLSDGSVHGLEIGAAADTDRAEGDATAGQQQGIEPGSGWRQARANQADGPPTANVFSDIAMVPGPPISTTQSTPRLSVSARTSRPNPGSHGS